MRVLVTGATGRVGSHFVPRLLQRGDHVRILVRQAERAESLRQRGAAVAIGDLLQPSTLAEALVGVDAVVHLAAFFRGAPDAEARAVNEGGAIAMAEAAIKAGISRFVFVSTNLAYGPGRNRPAREDDDLRPTHTYPITKAAAEQALRDLHCKRGFGPRTLRLAFVYGEGDPHISELMPALRTWNPAKRIQGLMGVRQVSG